MDAIQKMIEKGLQGNPFEASELADLALSKKTAEVEDIRNAEAEAYHLSAQNWMKHLQDSLETADKTISIEESKDLCYNTHYQIAVESEIGMALAEENGLTGWASSFKNLILDAYRPCLNCEQCDFYKYAADYLKEQKTKPLKDNHC